MPSIKQSSFTFGATVYINNVIILHIYSISNQYTLCPKKTVVPNFGDNFVKS